MSESCDNENAPPVNLDNIREMLGGDPGRERELFQIYIESAEECLDGMEKNSGPGGEQEWRTQAHALKGMSMNLGAETLGKLCADAQMNNLAPLEEKTRMFENIKAEYERVKAFLRKQTG